MDAAAQRAARALLAKAPNCPTHEVFSGLKCRLQWERLSRCVNFVRSQQQAAGIRDGKWHAVRTAAQMTARSTARQWLTTIATSRRICSGRREDERIDPSVIGRRGFHAINAASACNVLCYRSNATIQRLAAKSCRSSAHLKFLFYTGFQRLNQFLPHDDSRGQADLPEI